MIIELDVKITHLSWVIIHHKKCCSSVLVYLQNPKEDQSEVTAILKWQSHNCLFRIAQGKLLDGGSNSYIRWNKYETEISQSIKKQTNGR